MTSPEHWQQLKHCPSPFPALFLGFAAPGREQPQPQRIPSAAAASTHPGPRLSPPWAPTAHSCSCDLSCRRIPCGVELGLPQGLRASGTQAGLLHDGGETKCSS